MPAQANARRDPLNVERGDGRLIDIYSNEISIKISSRDTGGEYTVFESWTEPLSGPPLHLHHEQDECWYILEGHYRFQVDGKDLYASNGDTVLAPRGTRHTFQCIGTTPGRLLTTVIPGGLDLFFEEIETLVSAGTAPDPVQLVPIFQKHRLELLGPPLAAMGAEPGAN
jgi:mannose-6-phosphate isomerase-like protein (cupin superfamily)